MPRQYYRRKRRISFIPFSDYGRQDIPAKDSAPERVEQQMAIEESLLQVPYDQRNCMVLHFVEGFKYAEIARIMGISEEAVRKRVARGSQRFRAAYGANSGGNGE
ncbi:MAG: sigma-70 family RNA polymerase sigma factor [Dehalococcoidia bacterium]|nr:sigma-70 family RNA polymerase sigma factor [Dehalococcoidia bacterium]